MSIVAPEPISTTKPAREAVAIGAGVVVAAAFAPSIVAYYAHLWRLPHYQFFPLALLGAGYLAYHAPIGATVASRRERIVAGVAAAAALALLALSCGATSLLRVTLHSPWLGTAAAIVMAGAGLLYHGGFASLRAAMPAGLMLLATLRPPLNGDKLLIDQLQYITTQLAGRALDAFGLVHSVSGNVIEIPGRRLLVEEACSGVNSLFSTLACTLFYLLVKRRHPFVWIVLLGSVPIWVVFGNVLRVTTVALLRAYTDIPADEGLWHTSLGFFVFAITIGLVISTDQLLQFYAAVLPPEELELLPPRTSEDDAVAATVEARRQRAGVGAWLTAGVAAVLLVLQVPQFSPAMRDWAATIADAALPEFGAAAAAERFEAWERKDFKIHRRERDSSFGEFSQVWLYAEPEARAALSLDYPFIGWHELAECYTAQGWNIESRTIGPQFADCVRPVEVRLIHPQTARYGMLQFILVERDGRSLPPREHGELGELGDRLQIGTDLSGEGRNALTYQIQLFVETYVPLNDALTAKSRRLFAALAPTIRDSLKQQP